MPLITCPDCNREISDSARACPGCGRPSAKSDFSTYEGPISAKPARKRRTLSVSRLMMYGAIGCLGYALWSSSRPEIYRHSEAETATQPPAKAAGIADQSSVQKYIESANLGWRGNGPNLMTFDTDAEPSGAASCNVRIKPAKPAVAQALSIKSIAGKKSLDVELFKSSWSIPAGSAIPVQIAFAGGPSYQVIAQGFSHEVSFHVPVGLVSSFHGGLIDTPRVTLSFGQGDEPDWAVDLAGIGRPMAELRQCAMERILKNSKSQPL